jgi:hypothetical protein
VELENHYIEKVLIQPLVLHTDQFYIENYHGTKIDVSRHIDRVFSSGERASVQGTHLDVAIPYEGNANLWEIKASTSSLGGYPKIEVRDDVIILTITFPDDSADPVKIKTDIDSYIKDLAQAVEYLRKDVEEHNINAPKSIKAAIQQKRQLVESAIGAITKLGIPIKRREKPLTYIVPTKRRSSPATLPKVSTEKYKPEPTLEEKEYQHILKVMRSMSLVIERNPKAFSTLDEEAIRTHFLLQLNGHYEGGATGETFNASGKTDILIRIEGRNIFIAECKFWRGIKNFDEAITQLLGYLSWRDTKCALVIFNKTKDSSSILQKMHEAMEGRPEHRRTVSYNPNDDSRYIFIEESEPGREIIITTQIYDMPVLDI